MNTCISAVQHLRPLRGGAQSHLLRASDGNCYVTKFQNNPQHIRVLASEMLATRLGVALGLPMPQVEVIEVSEWLIEHTGELRIQLAGIAFRAALGGIWGRCGWAVRVRRWIIYLGKSGMLLTSPESSFSTNGRAMPMDGSSPEEHHEADDMTPLL